MNRFCRSEATTSRNRNSGLFLSYNISIGGINEPAELEGFLLAICELACRPLSPSFFRPPTPVSLLLTLFNMRQRIRDARERRDCQNVVPNARDHCEQSKEYFDPSDLGDVTYARPSDGVSGVKDLNGNPIKATFEAFPRAKILAAEIDVSRSTSHRNGLEKSKH